MQEMQVRSLSREDPWRRKWQPSSAFLPWKSHGQRSLVSYSPWGCKKIRHDLLTKQQNCKHYFQPQSIKRGFFFFFWLHPASCMILVPQLGIESRPPAVEAQSPNYWSTSEFPGGFYSFAGPFFRMRTQGCGVCETHCW